jgi:hypothetical protein
MKKLCVIVVILALLAVSCDNYIVVQRDPAVLNSSIFLSGEVTGDTDPATRTISMRASGQASNFLLLEIRGMESFCDTRSISVNDSLAGNQLYLNIIDDGTPGTERCYRNAQFWVGPFESDRSYTLHLSEMPDALYRDTLLLTFNYDQDLDMSVSGDGYYYLLSEAPFGTIRDTSYEDEDLPDFNYVDHINNIDTLLFFETDSGLLIRTLLDMDCDITHATSYAIDGDTLLMLIDLGTPGITGCNKLIFFDYLIEDYAQQNFYYQFYLTNSDWAMFEGLYSAVDN